MAPYMRNLANGQWDRQIAAENELHQETMVYQQQSKSKQMRNTNLHESSKVRVVQVESTMVQFTHGRALLFVLRQLEHIASEINVFHFDFPDSILTISHYIRCFISFLFQVSGTYSEHANEIKKPR
jgi:hypothetical protein